MVSPTTSTHLFNVWRLTEGNKCIPLLSSLTLCLSCGGLFLSDQSQVVASLSLKYPIKGASFKCTPTTTERSSQRGGGGVKAGMVAKN